MFDIAIIGGGINGCGIARDAAGRGLSVLLAEKGDLAGGTSSASTKLIHGGLRYLEQYDFRLVRESLMEREVLLRAAPHLVTPLRFVLPHHAGLRPAWLIRLGLLLYDHIGGRRSLPASRTVDLSQSPAGAPLKLGYTLGFEYSDCWVDDARLVVLNAMDAATRGAQIRVRTEVLSASRPGSAWTIELRDARTGKHETVQARALVNATGAWVSQTASRFAGTASPPPRIRLVKGSHIVVPRLFEHDSAYIFQNADRRIVFAIPYEQDFTLIGTTDVDFAGDPATAAIGEAEVAYLCAAVNEYFARSISPADVIWTYSGVRPLQDDGHVSAQDATRDFALALDAPAGAAPLLNLIGGKITTYRHVAEETMRVLAPAFPSAGPAWTHDVPLPGGAFPVGDVSLMAGELSSSCTTLSPATALRVAKAYGTMARDIFAGASQADLGIHFGAGLYEREVSHLIRREWAVTADDILWRRTKLGLRLNAAEQARLQAWLATRASRASSKE